MELHLQYYSKEAPTTKFKTLSSPRIITGTSAGILLESVLTDLLSITATTRNENTPCSQIEQSRRRQANASLTGKPKRLHQQKMQAEFRTH